MSRAVSTVVVTLIVAGGASIGVASASYADDGTVTEDSLFSNDRGMSLDKDYFEMSTPFGESETQTITLTATQDLTLRAAGEYSTPGDSFYVTRAGVCPGYFGTVAMKAGDSCTLTIVFTPSTTGSYWGGPSFVATVNGVSHDVGLNIHGNVETVVLSGPTDFGAVRIGESRTEQLTLTNVTRYDFIPTELLNYLAGYYGFSVANTSCVDTLAAGASCTIDLQFAPLYNFDVSSYAYATGTVNGQNAYSNGLSFVGSGSEGTVGLTATPIVDFGSVSEKSQASGTIVFTNTGEERLTFSDYSGWFSNYSGAFALAGSVPTALESGESAEVPVTFSAEFASVGEQLSDYNITGYTSSYTAVSATVALRALVTADEAVVDPTDPPKPVDPEVKPVNPVNPDPQVDPPADAADPGSPADPADKTPAAEPVVAQPEESASPTENKSALATTGAEAPLVGLGAATLLGLAGVVGLWLARRARKVS